MPKRRLLVFLSLCLVVCGCINSEDTFYLNPDGSGKVIHKTSLLSTDVDFSVDQGVPNEEVLKEVIKYELEKSEGVDTWGNFTYNLDSGGGITFEGVAYFKNIEKLKFFNFGKEIGLFNKIAFQTRNSLLALEITSDEYKKEKEAAVPSVQALSEEELTAKVTKQREQYQRSRAMRERILDSFKIKQRFYLPGEPVQVIGLEQKPGGSFVHDFNGKKLLQILDQIINDDALMRAEVAEGKDVVSDISSQPQLELLLGAKSIQTKISPADKPLFDYNSETAHARKQFKKVLNELDSIMPITAVVSGQPGEFKIAGVQITKFSDRNNFMAFDSPPFNSRLGYKICIYGPLPQEVLSVTEGKLTAAITDTREDVLPKQDSDREIYFTNLSRDKKAVMFQVAFKDLPDSASRIAELTGELNYLIAKKTKEIDLSLNSFKAGAVGKMFEARIKSIEPAQWDKKEVLLLDIKKPFYEIKEVKFYDADGKLLETEPRGRSNFMDSVWLHYAIKGGTFPAHGSVHAVLNDDLEKYTLPFSLKDIEIFHIKD